LEELKTPKGHFRINRPLKLNLNETSRPNEKKENCWKDKHKRQKIESSGSGTILGIEKIQAKGKILTKNQKGRTILNLVRRKRTPKKNQRAVKTLLTPHLNSLVQPLSTTKEVILKVMKEIQMIYRLFLVNYYILHIPRLLSQ
jgi:hypothetical protein